MSILLAVSVGGLRIGDMIFTLLFFLLLISIVITIVVLIVTYKKRGNRLQRIEAKLDKILVNKEKEI